VCVARPPRAHPQTSAGAGTPPVPFAELHVSRTAGQDTLAAVAPTSPFDPAAFAAARRRAGLSLAAVGKLVGVDRQRVWAWESGRATPGPSRLLVLAAAVGVDPLQLLRLDPDHPPLAGLRLRAGLTRTQLAKRAGLPRSTVDRLDRQGRRSALPAEMADQLASALGVSADEVRRACAVPPPTAESAGAPTTE